MPDIPGTASPGEPEHRPLEERLMSRLIRGPLLALLVATGLCALGLPPAAAAPAPTTGTGLLRMMHLSPDTPAVDAYIDSVSTPGVEVMLPTVRYGDVSPYQTVPAGTYTVSARAAGADPATPPVLATTVTVGAGTAMTVAGVGLFAQLGFEVLTDDLTMPPAGLARARVVSGAATGSPLNLSLDGGTTLAGSLAFADHTDYVEVPGGATTLTVSPSSGTPTQLPLQLAAGSVYTLLVLDRSGGGLTVTPALDAASMGVVPVGGVETGAGGTAEDGGLPAGRFALAALVLAGLALTVWARLPRGRRPARHAAR
ncbi:MAG: LPXTG-motif cell wall anchor domain protein [Modestobacter sp.]|nr:LPXTG-motif cell wall anchor domain protein [Modestobacter sp.]